MLATIIAAQAASPQSGYTFEFAASASSRYAEARAKPARSCAEPEAATTPDYTVISARPIEAVGEVPAHCRVLGFAGGTTRFELNLPARWNTRLYQHGTGGFAGALPDEDPWT